jgi:hypothetical protein
MPGEKSSGTPFWLASFRENFWNGVPNRSVIKIPLVMKFYVTIYVPDLRVLCDFCQASSFFLKLFFLPTAASLEGLRLL